MSEPEVPKGGAAIREKIAAAKAELRPKVREVSPAADAHLGWRMVIELVAGVGIGAAMGFGLDSLFGTLPVLLAVFTLLGFAAGVNLMLRTAREFQRGDRGQVKSGK